MNISHKVPKPTNARDAIKPVAAKPARGGRIKALFAGVPGILMLFVIGSIGFSTFMVFRGMDSDAAHAMLIPQVAFAGATLVKQFTARRA